MSQTAAFLSSAQPRARWMRNDVAQLLKRFFFCERSLVVSAAAWIPAVAPLEIKIGLARYIWQSAETAHALRNRVFELRFPNRILEEQGADRTLIDLFDSIKESPSVPAFLQSVGRVLLPSLRDAYKEYLDASDPIADGPTHRFLSLAHAEKIEQIAAFERWGDLVLAENPEFREEASSWSEAIADRLSAIGGVGVGQPPPTSTSWGKLPGAKAYSVPAQPARDSRFWPCRFYWPDVVDSSYPYGEGVQLQIRSAISHLNEVWAIETGALILSSFAHVLPWDLIHNSARWTYDEARHCQMGYQRLMSWGFEPAEIPLGTYIYESASGQDPIYRLGMLYFFETKNIRHKPTRAHLFHTYGDSLSEHDMDFDWADETIHAGYGRHWLKELLIVRGQDPNAHEEVRAHCMKLVSDCVGTATPEEVAAIRRVADALMAKAARISRTSGDLDSGGSRPQ
ncbi:MAG TPA: DUF455 family protein [Candidatus Acidoferrum sp.]|nr:DUF455 family protein [Candidatus Acidoferrum sp.]